ncbi:host attachment protein [Coxiella endosymbiont of Ornithodoros maritimus]|uniref:host attachment protein n=1 Tax=Coxiella endosymbiont of Ornithodoros maritimus TaxID=1656172 RepID=UPI002264A18A|nr:host attachment protein [Coxiella endosymbiont of Ornithodoros maritimus]
MKSWIVVANASKVIKYLPLIKFLTGKDNLELIEEYTHPESRIRDVEIASDRLGYFHAESRGSGSFVEQTNPKKYEAESFAREMVNDLESGQMSDLFQDIILVVTPPFHGLLNKCLNLSSTIKLRCLSKKITLKVTIKN